VDVVTGTLQMHDDDILRKGLIFRCWSMYRCTLSILSLKYHVWEFSTKLTKEIEGVIGQTTDLWMFIVLIFIILWVKQWDVPSCSLRFTVDSTTTGWAKKTGLFLEVFNSCICWHRIALYMPNCSVFYPE